MSDEFLHLQKAEEIADKLGLANQGKNSFIELCKQGCDSSFLAEHFYFITHNSTTTVTPKNKKRKAYKVSLRSLDSVELALGGFNKRQIKALQKKIKELAEDINKLNSIQLIRCIDVEELTPYAVTPDLPPLLSYYADKFIPFLLEKAKRVGDRQRPLFNLFMNSICSHVKEQTKRQQFKLICDVLNELGINWDVDALKQWYSRHKSESSETI
ncbi:MAG TPA: hypothetical protein VF553_02400 [Pyrinomonadaceae bacterium]|jgi:hypothetical protein